MLFYFLSSLTDNYLHFVILFSYNDNAITREDEDNGGGWEGGACRNMLLGLLVVKRWLARETWAIIEDKRSRI